MRKLFTLLAFALLSVAGQCQTTAHSATLSAPASATTGATYNVLRSTSSTGTFTAIATALAAPSYVDQNLPANTQFCYEMTASSVGNSDSAPTNIQCGTTGQNQTAPPGTLTVIFK